MPIAQVMSGWRFSDDDSKADAASPCEVTRKYFGNSSDAFAAGAEYTNGRTRIVRQPALSAPARATFAGAPPLIRSTRCRTTRMTRSRQARIRRFRNPGIARCCLGALGGLEPRL